MHVHVCSTFGLHIIYCVEYALILCALRTVHNIPFDMHHNAIYDAQNGVPPCLAYSPQGHLETIHTATPCHGMIYTHDNKPWH